MISILNVNFRPINARMWRQTRDKRSVRPVQNPTRGSLKTRDEDSKLPVEEDAGIRSDISHVVEALQPVSSLLKGSQFCSHAKPWLKIERKYDVQHLPELAPGEGRGREVMMRSPCGSSME